MIHELVLVDLVFMMSENNGFGDQVKIEFGAFAARHGQRMELKKTGQISPVGGPPFI